MQDDLVQSRKALLYGVGQSTQRNKALLPDVPLPAIPARPGSALPKRERRPVTTIDFEEVSFVGRSVWTSLSRRELKNSLSISLAMRWLWKTNCQPVPVGITECKLLMPETYDTPTGSFAWSGTTRHFTSNDGFFQTPELPIIDKDFAYINDGTQYTIHYASAPTIAYSSTLSFIRHGVWVASLGYAMTDISGSARAYPATTYKNVVIQFKTPPTVIADALSQYNAATANDNIVAIGLPFHGRHIVSNSVQVGVTPTRYQVKAVAHNGFVVQDYTDGPQTADTFVLRHPAATTPTAYALCTEMDINFSDMLVMSGHERWVAGGFYGYTQWGFFTPAGVYLEADWVISGSDITINIRNVTSGFPLLKTQTFAAGFSIGSGTRMGDISPSGRNALFHVGGDKNILITLGGEPPSGLTIAYSLLVDTAFAPEAVFDTREWHSEIWNSAGTKYVDSWGPTKVDWVAYSDTKKRHEQRGDLKISLVRGWYFDHKNNNETPQAFALVVYQHIVTSFVDQFDLVTGSIVQTRTGVSAIESSWKAYRGAELLETLNGTHADQSTGVSSSYLLYHTGPWLIQDQRLSNKLYKWEWRTTSSSGAYEYISYCAPDAVLLDQAWGKKAFYSPTRELIEETTDSCRLLCGF